jgi:predicted ATP-binding protein involved in virulence
MMLKKIRVSGLFGRFTHEIPVKLADRITIIHGPNGFGKTMVLRMIDTFFNHAHISLASIPFRELRLDFDNKTVVSVHRKLQESSGEQQEGRATVEITYAESGKSPQSFTPKSAARPEQLGFPIGMIEELIPELDQVDRQTWRHRGNGHDLVNILSMALRKAIGSQSAAAVEVEVMERALRLAYEGMDFASSELYRALREWEQRNNPFRVLS